MTTEESILTTARAHFVQYGYAGTRMQAIADDAGINKAMLHYYFRSKKDLYNTIVDDVLDTIFPRIASAIESTDNFWSSVEQLINTYIDTLLDHPEIPVFIMAELSHQRDDFIQKLWVRAAPIDAIKEFMMRFQKESEQGRLRPVSPQQLLLSLIGMLVFPFMTKPVFQSMMHMEEGSFRQLMIERKSFVMDFLRSALIEDNENNRL